MSPSTSTHATTAVPTFASLGVRPLINCRGTYTIISGSRLLPQAAQAMLEASNHYVHMEELMERVGERLAELTGAEWGLITCGCAAAINQITAACIAGADPERMARLPDATGMPNEVISQRAHRNAYDRAIDLAGGRIVEVVTEADLRAAISERTAMITITGDLEAESTIPVERMIAIARERGIPCFVDAAAQRLAVPNRYLAMGADAVGYSGGKCLRGPQASGLLLGRKDLLQAAYLNGAPHHSQGRPMKAGKEEIMGLLAAVEAFLQGRDHEAEWRMWEGYLETIRGAVADIPGIRTEVKQPGICNVAPTLHILWDQTVLPTSPAEIVQELYGGDPRIAVHQLADGVGVMPYMMEAGEAEQVAARLAELLRGPHGLAQDSKDEHPKEALPADVRGAWEIEIHYLAGHSHHSMILEHQDGMVSGDYRSQYQWSCIEGSIEGDQIALSVKLGCAPIYQTYAFTGIVQGNTMEGALSLGERWTATWTANRVS